MKAMSNMLILEVDRNTKEVINYTMTVPDLIGEYCPYSTFRNFMAQFHK